MIMNVYNVIKDEPLLFSLSISIKDFIDFLYKLFHIVEETYGEGSRRELIYIATSLNRSRAC